ncbi:hypothetical protein [Paractinoplanes atraurantiacus]|uniref:hypothetical protein n=1 Tax=Paractinoplanes atraurantiacus TaxID=1036182 RepID=UPI001FE82DC0|nr:hypothetical protein [Actinoplanes atraurantiacus]
MPSHGGDGDSHVRLRQLTHQLGSGDLHRALDSVRAEETAEDRSAVTLWRSEYQTSTSSMTVRFLLGLEAGRRYSPPVSVALR